MACSDKTGRRSVTCCTSSDFSSKHFDIKWQGDFCYCSSTTSFEWRCWWFPFCVLWCLHTMWEWRKDYVYIQVQADVMCVWMCMCVHVSFLQNSWTLLHRTPDRRKKSFCINLNFLSLNVNVDNKSRRPSTKPRPKPNAQTKAKCPEKKNEKK